MAHHDLDPNVVPGLGAGQVIAPGVKQGKAGWFSSLLLFCFPVKTQTVNIIGGSLTAAVRTQRRDHTDEHDSVPVALSALTFELRIIFMCHNYFFSFLTIKKCKTLSWQDLQKRVWPVSHSLLSPEINHVCSSFLSDHQPAESPPSYKPKAVRNFNLNASLLFPSIFLHPPPALKGRPSLALDFL